MRRAWTSSGLLMLFVGLGLFVASPARSQVTIPTSTTSTTKPTTTTTRPPESTTTPPGGQTTITAPKRATTTAPPATAPQRTTSTIPTPAPSPATTAAPTPISKHSGHFSPVFDVLAVMGLLGGLSLLGLQWFLTRPGRQGWTL